MWKETLEQLQTPRNSHAVFSSADGRKSPVAGWSIDSQSEQGCLLPLLRPMALGTLF